MKILRKLSVRGSKGVFVTVTNSNILKLFLLKEAKHIYASLDIAKIFPQKTSNNETLRSIVTSIESVFLRNLLKLHGICILIHISYRYEGLKHVLML